MYIFQTLAPSSFEPCHPCHPPFVLKTQICAARKTFHFYIFRRHPPPPIAFPALSFLGCGAEYKYVKRRGRRTDGRAGRRPARRRIDRLPGGLCSCLPAARLPICRPGCMAVSLESDVRVERTMACPTARLTTPPPPPPPSMWRYTH
jgi:hypothetical protein